MLSHRKISNIVDRWGYLVDVFSDIGDYFNTLLCDTGIAPPDNSRLTRPHADESAGEGVGYWASDSRWSMWGGTTAGTPRLKRGPSEMWNPCATS